MDTDDPRIEVEDLAESQEFINSLVRQSLEWTAVAEAAEAALAAAMAEGKSVAAIAQMRGVLPGSLRSQLTAIRRKTGCGSQADLAVLLARVGG